MQLAFHLGAPFTDNDQLIWSLRRDRHALAEAGIVVPRPRFFRAEMSKTTTTLRGRSLTSQEQDALLAGFGARPDSVRMILSDPMFICAASRIWHQGQFYGKAGFKTQWMRAAFSDHEVEFFIGLCNPASFLSALLVSEAPMTLDEHLQGADPGAMFWSEVIGLIREASPGCQVTVWCNEDTPFVWPLVLAAIAGIEADAALAGADAITRPLLTEEGQASLTAALGDPITAPLLPALAALDAHMRLFADPEAMHEPVDIPGWTDTHVEAMTEAYEQDIHRIAAMEGVTLIRPRY